MEMKKESYGGYPLPMKTKISHYSKPGMVNQDGYPDTQPEIVRDQSSSVKKMNSGKAKEGYRH